MTKILSTIGPVSQDQKNLKRIIKYSNFIRLNGAHNSISWHKRISENIKKINPSCKVLIDLPGIKPRTKNLQPIEIKNNEKVLFYYKKKPKNFSQIKKIELSNPLPSYKNPKIFSLSDGNYKFKFISNKKNYIVGISNQKFTLFNKKGLNIPNSIYNDKFQEKIYLNFLNKIKNIKIDAIGLSYVQNSGIIKKIKLKSNKIIVSKIENILGCKNLNNICLNSDMIMIDRGDLSAEIGENNLYEQTIKISKQTKLHGKLLIIATENLESMINSNSPTKSEIISLSFSKSLNADFLMLSDETATSKRFLSILNWLDNFNKLNLKKGGYKKNNLSESLSLDKFLFFFNKIDVDNTKILIFTRKGYVIERVLKINPKLELIIFTDNQRVFDLSCLRSNCTSYKTDKFPQNLDKFIYSNIKKHKNKIFYNKKYIFLIYASFARKKSRANTITIIERKDFE